MWRHSEFWNRSTSLHVLTMSILDSGVCLWLPSYCTSTVYNSRNSVRYNVLETAQKANHVAYGRENDVSTTWMGLLPDTWNCGLRMRRECRERFPRHQLQRKPLVSNPGMHHGTCVTHVPWCMSGSLTCGGRGKRSRHSRRMRNPQFYVSGKRPIDSHRHVVVGMCWCCYKVSEIVP